MSYFPCDIPYMSEEELIENGIKIHRDASQIICNKESGGKSCTVTNGKIIFPRDCSRRCPHFRTWDMSIDDWTSVCDLLKIQVDDCDMDYKYEICPNNGADMAEEDMG